MSFLLLLKPHTLLPPHAAISSRKVQESLEYAQKYQATSNNAQQFIEKYMKLIISTILSQQYVKSDKNTNQKITSILKIALDIVSAELSEIGNKCNVLDALASIFNKKQIYYGDTTNGNPQLRVDMIEMFSTDGFDYLELYLVDQTTTPVFPSLETIHLLLVACIDATFVVGLDKPAYGICRAVMNYLIEMGDVLSEFSTKDLYLVRQDLKRLCKILATDSRPQIMSEFNRFWRRLTMKLIKSKSQEQHKLFGLKELGCLVEACRLPAYYTVTGAGSDDVNGRYEVSSSLLINGCVNSQTVVTYEKTNDSGKKTMKIQPCLMSEPGYNHCETWYFLSSTKGVDYYFHQTNPEEHDKPPITDWECCTEGQNPSPALQQSPETFPMRDGKGNLEKQLTKWAVENDVYGTLLAGCIDESHIRASTMFRNFISKSLTPNLSGGELSKSLGQGPITLLEPILPLLTSGGSLAQYMQQLSSPSPSVSNHFMAIEAAKQRLISAERLKRSTETALQSYLDASREVQAARSYLNELERLHGVINVDTDDEDDEAPQAKRSKKEERKS